MISRSNGSEYYFLGGLNDYSLLYKKIKLRHLFSSLWFLGIATLIIFPVFGYLFLWMMDGDFWSMFHLSHNSVWTIPAFLSSGILFGLAVIWLSELPYFEKSMRDYKNILQRYEITIWHAFFLSFCAGFGEEIFFRGAVQPYLGIWSTAIIFVAIHTYFSMKDMKKNVFAILLTLYIACLGWGAQEFSLWHVISGHFSYDLVLMMYIRKD